MRYISSKSELVDAWQIDAEEIRYQGDYPDWIGDLIRAGRIMHSKYPGQIELYVNFTDKIFVNHGEYIVRDTSNNLSACTASYFNENYEEWNGDYDTKSTTKSFVIESIEDHDDGSCTIHMDMDIETLKVFASIGIKQVLMDEAKKVLKENDP
jgi:hypothetical protein